MPFFSLLAENQTAFLPTILSRTVLLHIRPLPDTMVADYLEKKKGLSRQRARFMPLMPREALDRRWICQRTKVFSRCGRRF